MASAVPARTSEGSDVSTGQWGLLGAVTGMAVGLGLWLVVRGWLGAWGGSRRPSPVAAWWRRARAELPEVWARHYRWVAVGGGAAAVLFWGVSGRPVHGVAAGAAVAALPWIWNPAGSRTQWQIARLEALAEWLRLLAGSYSSGATLESAVSGSVSAAPAPVRPAVARLAARLEAGVTPQRAYRLFADDLADGAVDHVVKVFLTHTARRGRGLTAMLRGLASYTERQATSLRAVDTDRAKVRSSARWVAVISLAWALLLVTFTSYGEEYRTAQGQLVLLVLSITFTLSLVWLRRLAATRPAPRGLRPLAERERRQAERTMPVLSRLGSSTTRVSAMAGAVPALLCGGAVGAGLFLLVYGLLPRPGADLARMLARMDRTEAPGQPGAAAPGFGRARLEVLPERIGGRVLPSLGRLGVPEEDLRILRISPERHIGTKILGAVAGLAMPPVFLAVAGLMGMSVPVQVPLVLSLAAAALLWINADVDVRARARRERELWLYAIASYLERVTMARLAGAAPEAALESEAAVGDTTADEAISAALQEARVMGVPPWTALERLGARVGVPELVKPAAAARRAAEGGVPIAEVLATQAEQLGDQLTAARTAAAHAASEVLRVPGTAIFMQLMAIMLYPGLQAILSLS